jgi:hypothetical protein
VSRRVMASAIFGLGILVASGYGQPPGGQPGPGQPLGLRSAVGPSKNPDPTDALVQAALAIDPDVRLAQAKMLLAEAELAKAKQAIALKVMALKATIQDLKIQVDLVSQKAQLNERGGATVALADLLDSRLSLERAKGALAKAELELKLLTTGAQTETHTGTSSTSTSTGSASDYVQAANQAFSKYQKEKNETRGPMADRIRTALDKKVKLGNRGEQVGVVKALEIFKNEAGLDVPFHAHTSQASVRPDGQELTVGAWIQLFEDNNPVVFYVREYGLLVTAREVSPPNALTVFELWKQPLKKDADEQKKVEPFLRKYTVPAGMADTLAKMVQNQYPRLQAVPGSVTNEILVLASELDHIAVTRMLKEISNEGTIPDPKSKSQPPPGR